MGKSEMTMVKNNWIKTNVMSGLTSYVKIQNIDGGQVKTQYIFLNGNLVELVMTVHSIIYSLIEQNEMLCGPSFEFIGPEP